MISKIVSCLQIIHVEVAVPQYCTAEAVGDGGAIRVVPRDAYGRALLAPAALPEASPHHARAAKPQERYQNVAIIRYSQKEPKTCSC